MRIRSVFAATGCILALALAGCGNSIAGSAQAALPVAGAAGTASTNDSAELPADTEDLSLPSEGDPAPAPDSGELPGLSDALQGLSDLSALGDGETLDPNQLSELLGSLGGADALQGVPGLSDIMSSECLSIAGASMSLGFLLLAPMMGEPLTSSDVDSAFKGLKGVPPELSGAIDTLHSAAQAAVGKSSADASKLMSDPAVSDAMDEVSKYLDAHCGGQ